MKSIKHKLQSNEGASITFALLLFLVCAVVSSVVLTAGTAASGRLSEIAKMDQRYYSVTSAAELLKDQFENKKVEITETTETNITNIYYADGRLKEKLPGTPSSEGKERIITDILTGSVVPASSLFVDAAEQYAALNVDGSVNDTFSQELSLTTTASADLNVTIKESIYKSGDIIFTIYNTTTGSNGEVFTLKMIFSGNTDASSSKKAVSGTPIVSADKSTYSITTTETETKTISASWTLNSIEAVRQEAATSESGGGH